MAMLAGLLRPVVRKTSRLAPSLASTLRMDLVERDMKKGGQEVWLCHGSPL